MFYIFQSGVEFVKLKIDRINKKLEIASSNVNYRFIPQPFWKLFGDKKDDIEEANKEMAETEKLDDNEFEIYLVKEFLRRGYVLVKRDKEVIKAEVESSGFRYIDFYKSVGTDSGGNWYAGYLSGDGVHPNTIGAEALATQVLTDFPELMQYGKTF